MRTLRFASRTCELFNLWEWCDTLTSRWQIFSSLWSPVSISGNFGGRRAASFRDQSIYATFLCSLLTKTAFSSQKWHSCCCVYTNEGYKQLSGGGRSHFKWIIKICVKSKQNAYSARLEKEALVEVLQNKIRNLLRSRLKMTVFNGYLKILV